MTTMNLLLGCSLGLNVVLALALVASKLTERDLREHLEEQRRALMRAHGGHTPVIIKAEKKTEEPKE